MEWISRTGRNVLESLKLILVARTIGLDIVVYKVVPIILGATVKIGRRGYIPYVGVHLIVASNSRHYIYAAKPSRIPIPSYYLRIRI